MENAGTPGFDLILLPSPPLYNSTRGRWTPRDAEVQICRDIVGTVAYPVPAPESDPLARYLTLAKFIFDAIATARAQPAGTLPQASNGELLKDSLAVFLMRARTPVEEFLTSPLFVRRYERTVGENADELHPVIVAFRHAVGTVGGADESFWTPAAPGQGLVYSL